MYCKIEINAKKFTSTFAKQCPTEQHLNVPCGTACCTPAAFV